MPANLSPSYAPIGGGGRTISIGVPDDVPAGYHWVRNLLNGQVTGGTQTSYPLGTQNSNFAEGTTNYLTAVYEKDAGNSNAGPLQVIITLGFIRTGDDPAPPTVSVVASTMPGMAGLVADYSGDGLVQRFRCKISTTAGVGESGIVSISYAPPAGFKGLMWYTISVTGYTAQVAVNGNGTDNSNYNLRNIPNSQSGWDRGGGVWRGPQRAFVYPISQNLLTSVVTPYSTSPNFAIGESNNADGINSLEIQISRADYYSQNLVQWQNSGNTELMNIASGYTTVYGYGTNGQVYQPPDVNGAGCIAYRPANSVELYSYNNFVASNDIAPKPNASMLSQNQCPDTHPYDAPYFTTASTSILQTDAIVTVWLEKAPEPIPGASHGTPFCYATGGTTTITGINFTGVDKVYTYYGTIDSSASINVISDTEIQVTLAAGASRGTIGIGKGSSSVGFVDIQNGGCPAGTTNYAQVAKLPNPPPAPTPSAPNSNVCMDGWTFGVQGNTTFLWNGPKIVDYNGTVFMAPSPDTFTLSAIQSSLTFDMESVYAQNGAYLNPGAGEIISIIDWGYPYDGNYYVISNVQTGTILRRLQLSCTNTSPTPTPSPIQTGTCIAPANTNTGPFVFPTSPSINQIYSFHGRAWYWNSYAWNRYCVGLTAIDPSASFAMCVPLTATLSYPGHTSNFTFEDTLSNGNPGNWNIGTVTNAYMSLNYMAGNQGVDNMNVFRTTQGVVYWGFSTISGGFSTAVPIAPGGYFPAIAGIPPNGTNSYEFTNNDGVVYTASITWGALL